MGFDREDRGPLWVDGRFTVRVRGPGPEPGRVVRVRRPFALVGRHPGADIRVDDPAAEGRHAFLLLDRRGVFGVDLLSRSGTRFAGAPAISAWLGAGDILEVAGRRIELLQVRVDGSVSAPPLSDDDPLSDAPGAGLASLTLEPAGGAGPPWMLGSALAFVGRGEACAIRIEGQSASETHCALLRTPGAAFVIDLLGRRTLLNGRPVEGASALLDGDELTLGPARFLARVGHPAAVPGLPARPFAGPTLAGAPGAALLPMLALDGASPPDPGRAGEVIETLRRFQADAASLLEAQMNRIEDLGAEIAALREELRGRRAERPEPLRLELPARSPAESTDSATWLLERIGSLEAEGRSTWRETVARVARGIRPNAPTGRPS